MAYRRNYSLPAFTLIELLVVIVMISLLMQLLVPAVQASRERARRLTCQNHLKQFALATQSHLDVHKFFPSGGWSGNFLADPHRGYGRNQPGGWLFSLLEYAELSSLRTAAAAHRLEDTTLSEGLKTLYQSGPDLFYCPSRRVAQPYPFKRDGNGRWSLNVGEAVLQLSSVTKSDYAANSGDTLQSAAEQFSGEPVLWTPESYQSLQNSAATWSNTNDVNSRFYQSGVSYYRSEVRPTQVVDGLTNTYLCGEKSLPPEIYDDVNESRTVAMMGDNQSVWVGFEWDNHRVAWNPSSDWSAASFQPRSDSPASDASPIFAFGSAHPRSFNMAFCDGSVREVAYDIDEEVHRSQANRLDGD